MARTPDSSEEALTRLQAAVDGNPRSTAFVALAHRLCEAGRAAEAEDVCRRGLQGHPGLVTGQVALGRALCERGRLEEAQQVLVDAVRASPEHGDAFRWLGQVLVKGGDLPRARAILEYAEEIVPHDSRVGDLLLAAGGTPSAPPTRLQTDFEQTRVGNARALAQRMLDEPGPTDEAPPPPQSRSGLAPPGAGGQGLGGGEDDPTNVDSRSLLLPRAMGARPARSGSAGAPGTPRPISSPPQVAVVRTSLRERARQRLANPIVVAATAVVVVGLSAWGATRYFARAPAPPDRRGELRRALALGSLDSLEAARGVAERILTESPDDGETAALLAFTRALLARDYGLPEEAGATAALERARAAGPETPRRTALIEATRALLALATDGSAAAQHAAKAIAAAPEAPESLLVSARVKAVGGDYRAAREELARARAQDASSSLLAQEQAVLWLDLGEPKAAAQALEETLPRGPRHARAHLLLADARRALGEPRDRETIERACRDEAPRSPSMRATCALEEAVSARFTGDRGAAVKSAQAAAAEAPADPRLLAQIATELVSLGEVDAATATLERARGLASAKMLPLAWTDLALRVSRGQAAEPGALARTAAGPQRRLILARAALARGESAALLSVVKATPRPVLAQDPDLRALALLGRGSPRQSPRELETRASRGDPVAAYVLGKLAERSGDSGAAARHLEGALWGHGEACAAAVAYTRAMTALGRRVATAVFRPLRAQNAACLPAQPDILEEAPPITARPSPKRAAKKRSRSKKR